MAQLTCAGATNNYNDYIDGTQSLGQHTRSGFASGSDSARASSKSLPIVKPVSSEASDTLTPAQQRELERESAYKASTGSAAAGLTDVTSTASGNSRLSQPSWGAIAGHPDGSAAQTSASEPESAVELPQSSTVKQQSMGDDESKADMEDYDPRAFATGSTDTIKRAAGDFPADPTGQAQAWNPRTSQANTGSRVQPSMGGEEAFEEQGKETGSMDFMADRDATDSDSVESAHQGRAGQLTAADKHGTVVHAAETGMTSFSFAEWLAVIKAVHVLSYRTFYDQISSLFTYLPNTGWLDILPPSVLLCMMTSFWFLIDSWRGVLRRMPCSGGPSALWLGQ